MFSAPSAEGDEVETVGESVVDALVGALVLPLPGVGDGVAAKFPSEKQPVTTNANFCVDVMRVEAVTVNSNFVPTGTLRRLILSALLMESFDTIPFG